MPELPRQRLRLMTAEIRCATLDDMARKASAAKLDKGKPLDASSRSREILKAEFPGYIRRKKSA